MLRVELTHFCCQIRQDWGPLGPMHILSNILLLAIHFFTFIFCDSKLQQIQLHRIEEDVVQMHQGQFRGEWSREVDSYKLQGTR